MTKRYTLFFLFFLFFIQTGWCQPKWRDIVSPAFLRVIEEINDSIAQRRSEADMIRAEMNKIILGKQLDRALIAGKDDEYINEGMHKNFKTAPGPMQGHFDRDKQIVRLENLHVDLYYCDKSLFNWLDLLKRTRNHPDLTMHSRWARDWNALPADQRPNANSLIDCQKWVAGQLVCDLVKKSSAPFPGPDPEKVGSFDPKVMEGLFNSPLPKGSSFDLPLESSLILASYPTDGQFAFHRSESIPGVGYIFFPKSTSRQFVEMMGKNMSFKARWTSAKGKVVYTIAEFRYGNGQFYFNLPRELQAEMIYRLELIALPSSSSTSKQSPQDCWRIFRGKPVPELTTTDIPLPGEVKITELYFRAGKYDILKKPETMAGTVDWQQGAIQFETDEPLDEIEMYGTSYVPATVTFGVQTINFFKVRNALNSKSVFYYLTVPRVEPLDNIPATQLVAAELDHTLDAPFVRKISLGNPDAYPQLPEIRKQDIILPGKYIAPAFQNVGVKDSLVTDRPVPFITKDLFMKKRTLSFASTKCTLFIGEIRQLLAAASIQQQQLHRRVNERAQFFYELEKRQALRDGKTFTATLEQFRQQEQENLPSDVQTLLEAQFPDAFQKDFTVLISRRFPGTEQGSASLTIPLDPKK